MIFAIDPGTEQSGYCVLAGRGIYKSGVLPNAEMLRLVQDPDVTSTLGDILAIEMVASYGMPVGREVFETVRWIGRFQQAWSEPEAVRLVYRQAVKLHLCKSVRAKDANIWQALKDRFGPEKLKVLGVKSHARSALAVAVTVYDQLKGELQ